MSTTLQNFGISFVAAAIVGGGLEAFGIKIPLLHSVRRQIMLGSFGTALLFTPLITRLVNQKPVIPGNNATNGVAPLTGHAMPIDTASERRGMDGINYVFIPPGGFTMGLSPGDTDGDYDETPAHPVTLSKGFRIGQTEVTQSAYSQIMRANPSHFKGDSLPVESVTWDDASEYCRKIGGRLPTEAEWEYAARAGNNPARRYGHLDDIAWYFQNSGSRTHEVHTRDPNAFGLYDMLGNVWEWTSDWYSDTYYSESFPRPILDPGGPGPKSGKKVARGGCFGSSPIVERASNRYEFVPLTTASSIGFRCVIP